MEWLKNSCYSKALINMSIKYVSGSVLQSSASWALLREGLFMTAEEMLLISRACTQSCETSFDTSNNKQKWLVAQKR